MRPSRVLSAAAVAALLLSGCATSDRSPDAASRSTTTAAPVPAAALLAEYDLTGMDVQQVVDHLDRLGGPDRPTALTASVRPGELQLSAGGEKASMPIPADRFYLSVAPYLHTTHECFYHSLTTCKGELGGKPVRVLITDETHGTVLVDATRTTFANGFVGFWLPRDIKGTLRISYDGRSAETDIATGPKAPTCLTTLKLT